MIVIDLTYKRANHVSKHAVDRQSECVYVCAQWSVYAIDNLIMMIGGDHIMQTHAR